MSKMGRPEIEIDLERLGAFCRLKPTLEDCAAFFKCSPDTIAKRIKDEMGLTFTEFRDQNVVHTRYDLVRKAIRKCDHSDTMHIFVLKNLCGWRDKQPDEVDTVIHNNNTVSYEKLSESELDAKIREKLGKGE